MEVLPKQINSPIHYLKLNIQFMLVPKQRWLQILMITGQKAADGTGDI